MKAVLTSFAGVSPMSNVKSPKHIGAGPFFSEKKDILGFQFLKLPFYFSVSFAVASNFWQQPSRANEF